MGGVIVTNLEQTLRAQTDGTEGALPLRESREMSLKASFVSAKEMNSYCLLRLSKSHSQRRAN